MTFRARSSKMVPRIVGAPLRAEVDVAAAYRSVVTGLLERLHEHHSPSAQHSHRVAALAELTAATMQLTPRELEDARLVGLLHDVGKLDVPRALLDKACRLTRRELRVLRAHSTHSARIVAEHGLPSLADAVSSVHERVDGYGYPLRLRGSAIPLAARIVAVCDAYDAMTSLRTYRRAITSTQAVQEIGRCAGHQFDPVCAAAFIAALAGGY